MANFSFITSSPVSGQDSSIEYQPSTATPFVTPTWQSVVRANQSMIYQVVWGCQLLVTIPFGIVSHPTLH